MRVLFLPKDFPKWAIKGFLQRTKAEKYEWKDDIEYPVLIDGDDVYYFVWRYHAAYPNEIIVHSAYRHFINGCTCAFFIKKQ
ncbi:MAG: hypothetical protein ACTSXW_08480 [Candidatus Baldrarchaeia archaeon]